MKQHLESDTSGPGSIVDVLRSWASDRPEQRVFSFHTPAQGDAADVHLSFGTLDRRARALGARLRALGLEGERAVLLYPPGLEFVPAFFGCLAAGVVAVPMHLPRPNRPMDRLRAIVEDARPGAILTTAVLCSERPRWSAQVPALDELPWLATDRIEGEAGLAEDWRDPGVGPGTLAFLQYTSGSTAAPKGVMVTHGNLLHNSALIQGRFRSTPESRGVFWLPLHHDMGLIGGVLQTVYCGGASTLMAPVAFLQDPIGWLEVISRTGATIGGGPNFAYDLCARKIEGNPGRRGALDLGRWTVAFNGAEPIRAETLDRFAEAFAPCGFRREAFLPCYGLAEATLMVAGHRAPALPVILDVDAASLEQDRVRPAPAAGPATRTLVASGAASAGQEIVIVDPATGRARPADGVGEIWIAGPSVAVGYWGRPEETAETFRAVLADSGAGPFLRTGDLGFLENGELFVTGRLKDLMIIRGRNIYPQDVEATVARSHPLLRADSCAAFSVEADGVERLVVAGEVERQAGPGRAEEIIGAIRRAIAEEHELEADGVLLLKVGGIPRTSSGKIRRHACREQFLAGDLDLVGSSNRLDEPRPVDATPATRSPGVPPGRSAREIEEWLEARLAGSLGVDPSAIDPRRPFSQLGLGSMRAVALAGELQEWLGRPLSPTLFYEYPTIADLAPVLAEGAEATGRDPVPVPGASDEPIALIGIGCRFPGADGPEEFWRLMCEGRDAIVEAPEDRRDILAGDRDAPRGGYLDRVDRFDADFFGLSPREATSMDPQQRLLLEVAWEALEDAGQAPERLAGSSTGVFVGISTDDYGRLAGRDDEASEVYRITGNAASIAANRLSYVFDFRGPSMAIDTACSSSLVAVQQACEALRSGAATLALAGGVNVILSPLIAESFRRAGMIAPDGRCKAFDATADGYVRGEGAGLVVLKPLARALADGDPIYALIRGGAINQDGRTNGLTAPSPQAQEAVIRAAYRRAGIAPGQVGYVEAHGTGTFLGDPIEVKALGSVLAEGRPEGRPCVIGSVKTNIGHLEAAAGIAGLIKVALLLEHRAIPPNLHFERPNPQIPFEDLPLVVPRALASWPEGDGPAFAGVSSFGFGGTNAHLVLEGVAGPSRSSGERPAGASLLPISARRPEALKELARAYREALSSPLPGADTGAIAFSAGARRGHHDHRLALIGHSRAEWIAQLDAFLGDETHRGLVSGRAVVGRRPRVVLAFPGQGGAWLGLGRDLLGCEPVFREALEECDRRFRALSGVSVIEELSADAARSCLAGAEVAGPVVFALGVALAALWRSWGIVPDAAVGPGAGAIAAAHVSGALSLEEAVLAIDRGRSAEGGGPGETGRFAAALDALIDDGHEVFLEVGPDPDLAGKISRALQRRDRAAMVLPSFPTVDDGRAVMLESLGMLYTLGAPIAWDRLEPSARFVRLPAYPWQRERFWWEAGGVLRNVGATRAIEVGPSALRRDGEQTAAEDDPGELLFEVQWPFVARTTLPPGVTDSSDGTWLIFDDASGLGRALQSRLEGRGAACRLVDDPEGFRRLLEALRDEGRRVLGVLHLRGLDLPSWDAPDVAGDDLDEAAWRCVGGVLPLARALADLGGSGEATPRLWIMTRGAQPVGGAPGASAVLQAPLWGMGRSIALEFPEVWGGLIDLDPAGTEDDLAAVVDEVLHPDGEDQLAFRGGRRHVARLVRSVVQGETADELRLRPEGTYLVTGGLGDLGLQAARWLVGRGARRLVLLGRRGLPGRSRWDALAEDDPVRAAVAGVRELERLGATVMTPAVDVADAAGMARLFEQLGETMPPLRGIVHAAGVISTRTARDLDRATFEAVLRPKVQGTLVLDRLTRDLPLDFFAAFSSVASVFGFKEAAYAAANQFLDAFAHASRAAGRPVLSVDWGPWAGAGMADSAERARAQRLGLLNPLEPRRGFRALERLIGRGVPQAVVADVDWSAFKELYRQEGRRQFLDRIDDRPGTGRDAADRPRHDPAGLREAPPDERRARLLPILQGRIGAVLELDPERVDPGRSLDTFGLDSLTAIELKTGIESDLGIVLPLARLLQGPTLAELADEIASLLGGPAPEPSPALARSPAARAAAEHPLSAGQRALWSLQQLAPESAAYNIAGAARVRSELDVDVLRRCFHALSDRHASLRTTFSAVDGRPVQRVHEAEAVAVDFRAEDASALGEADLARRLAEEARRPFDLERGPLFRARLFSRSERDHVVLLAIHHIVSDFWSVAVLMEELGRIYGAIRGGLAADLAPLEIQAVDFARWQAERLAGADGERLWAYWRGQLAAPLPVLDLPTDRRRPPLQTDRGASRSLHLDRELTRRLVSLGGARGASLYITLLAALQALLHRYTGQDDFIVGSPVAGRDHAGLAGVVGYFVNALPMRGDLAGNPSFATFLGRVKRTVLDGLDHQDFPFALMVDRLDLVRDPGRSPVFQVLFVFQKAQVLDKQGFTPFALRESGPRMDLGGLPLESMPLEMGTAQFDLTLVAAEGAGHLALALEYNADLFDGATIDRLLGHYRTLLEAVVAAPDRPIARLPILPAEERRRLLSAWSTTRAEVPREDGITQLFEAQAGRDPEALAIVFADQEVTYAALNARANRLAHHLLRLGVRPEARVGLCVERSVAMVVGILGILKAGGAYVPLDPDYPEERLAFIVGDAGIDVLLTQESLRGRLVDRVDRVVCLDGESDSRAIDGEREDDPVTGAGGDNLSYVIYTSGSTGTPKGVMVSQRNLVHSTHARLRYYHEPVSGFLLLSSFAFDSSVAGIFGTLCQGGTLVLPPPGVQNDPVLLARMIVERRVSHLLCVPSLYELLLAEAPDGRLDGLRVAIVAGETCRRSLVERHRAALPRTALVNEYGPTEATVWCSAHRCRAAEDRALVPIGRPIANTRLYVLDAQGEPVPIGVTGELYVGGPGVARGYLDRPALTAERFLPDPFGGEPGGRLYRTGDLARWRADGELEFLGRIDDQVKVRGYRIEPGEVESALGRHPAASEVAVVAREDVPGDVRLVAYIVADAGQGGDVGVAEWRRWARERLPESMVPASFVLLDRLPRSPNGKIDRSALPPPDPANAGPDASYVAPRDPVEERLATIAAGVLGRERVGVHDNFFDLGVDSILGIQIASRARQAGLHVSPAQLFQHPTIAELAGHAGTSAAVVAEQGAVSGPLPLTPIQRWFFAQDPAEPHHFNQGVLLEVRPTPDPERLSRVMALLVAHHDALRMRFHRSDAGWTQDNAAEEPAGLLSRFDLSALAESEQPGEIEAIAGGLQRSLDLSRGPLLRAAVFDLGAERPGRLLLVIHHLVVDGVSWRILLEDLWTLDRQLARGGPPALPPKTTSFRQWAEALAAFARSVALANEAAYWQAEGRAEGTPLPVGLGDDRDPGVVGSAATLAVALDADGTQRLLNEVPGAYGTQINDALLAALALAVADWTGRDGLRVDLEGHGREEIIDGVDLSRTVGWFTTLFPVTLRLGSARDPGAALRSIKEQLRRVPRRGIGHGLLRWMRDDAEPSSRPGTDRAPEIRFNYLGQLDSTLPEASGYARARESIGPLRSPIGRRGHLLEIDAWVIGGRLELEWTYQATVHRRETIDGLAGRFLAALGAIIAHCGSAEVRGFTPSDFPLAGLDAGTLDRLVADGPPIEDVYPLSAVQEGMLFHSLFDPSAGVYIQQFTCVLNGALDVAAFGHAWAWVVRRHTALRTAFPMIGGDRSLQVVYRQAPLPIAEHDWRALGTAEQARRLDSFFEADRARGFDVSQAPLMRLALFRLADESYQLAWSCHHVLTDGWCLPLLLREVLAGYEAFVRGGEPGLPAARPYRDYIAWLLGQDDAEAEAYWRRTLAGFNAPTPMAVDRPWAPVGDAVVGESGVMAERQLRLSPATTAALQAQARANQLTLNTLFQGAWALLLGRYSGQSDVVFGATVSGRPAELPGVEGMVGLFINTLPVRVDVAEEAPLRSWLKAIQDRQLAQRPFESTPLVEVQGWSDVPRGRPLFESIVVFENYPIDASLPALAGRLGVEGVRVLERTNYPLTLTVVPGQGLLVRAGYDARRFDAATIDRLLGHLETLLEGFVDGLDRRLEDLPLLSTAEQELLLRQWNGYAPEVAALDEIDGLSPDELDGLIETLLKDPEEVGHESNP